MTISKCVICAAGVIALASVAAADGQTLTIPERLAARGTDSTFVWGVGSGASPTMNELLADVDRVVRGTLGEPRSYLSDDQREVHTDYPLVNPVILYESGLSVTANPGLLPAVTVTQLGGTVAIGSLRYTEKHETLPPLQPGTEGLFLLKQVGTKYRIAGWFYGVFGVSNGLLVPLTKKDDFAPEYRGMPVAQAEQAIVPRLLERRR